MAETNPLTETERKALSESLSEVLAATNEIALNCQTSSREELLAAAIQMQTTWGEVVKGLSARSNQ